MNGWREPGAHSSVQSAPGSAPGQYSSGGVGHHGLAP
jgi:hypothetical protein